MADGGDPLPTKSRPIRGGSLGEADLPVATGVAWRGRAKPAESPPVS
jgi:hypothetical protein